jgi:hypothetical protein
LDFLAEVTQHIPDKGEHLVRYNGCYSHRQRGIHEEGRKAGQAESDKPTIDRSAVEGQQSTADGASPGGISPWAMLIKRVYEVDPLECPYCGGQMKIVSFVGRGQGDVIEQILRHCGLWEGPLRTRVVCCFFARINAGSDEALAGISTRSEKPSGPPRQRWSAFWPAA